LVTDDDMTFDIGDEIAFIYEGHKYIVEILDIGEISFTGTNIEKDK